MRGKISREKHKLIRKTFNLGVFLPGSEPDDNISFFRNDDDDIFISTQVESLLKDNSDICVDNINDDILISDLVAPLTKDDSIVTINDDDDDLFCSSQIDSILKPLNDISQSTPKKRFMEISTDAEILNRMKENVPLKTRYQNNWGVAVWKQWAEWRNGIVDETLPENFESVPLDVNDLTEEKLGFWLARFVLEVKKKNGSDYPPYSLYQICCAIQRAFNDRSSGKFKNATIFDRNNPHFYKFYEALDSRMRELTQQGIGVKVNQADFITPEDEMELWDSKEISLETGQGLLNGIYFYNTKCFSLRGGQIHRNLQKDQYEIDIDLESGLEVLKFYERLSKTTQGGLRGRKIKPRTSEIFADPQNSHCVVKLFKTYLAKIPDGPLYLKPSGLQSPMFSNKIVGKNMLGSMMPKMFQDAKIDTTGLKISEHSGRVTMCTTLFNEGFSEKSVKKRSGHRSNAVDLYMREKIVMRKRASSCLQGVESKKLKRNNSSIEPSTSSSSNLSTTQITQNTPSPLESAFNFIKDVGKGEVKVNLDGTFSVLFS